jgi:hypothetical protein
MGKEIGDVQDWLLFGGEGGRRVNRRAGGEAAEGCEEGRDDVGLHGVVVGSSVLFVIVGGLN